MNPLSSRTRALRLGYSLFLTLVLAACGGGKADIVLAEQASVTPPPVAAPVPAPLAPVIRCAP